MAARSTARRAFRTVLVILCIFLVLSRRELCLSWASRPGRVQVLKKLVRKMLVIFPFEEKFYRERGVDASFVGHPLAELPDPSIERADYAKQFQLDADYAVVIIFYPSGNAFSGFENHRRDRFDQRRPLESQVMWNWRSTRRLNGAGFEQALEHVQADSFGGVVKKQNSKLAM